MTPLTFSIFLWDISGDSVFDFEFDDVLCYSVPNAGDVNEDDVSDIVVETPDYDYKGGAAYVFYGKSVGKLNLRSQNDG